VGLPGNQNRTALLLADHFRPRCSLRLRLFLSPRQRIVLIADDAKGLADVILGPFCNLLFFLFGLPFLPAFLFSLGSADRFPEDSLYAIFCLLQPPNIVLPFLFLLLIFHLPFLPAIRWITLSFGRFSEREPPLEIQVDRPPVLQTFSKVFSSVVLCSRSPPPQISRPTRPTGK